LPRYGKKLNLTQQKHAFTNQKKCTRTHNKLKPGLVVFRDIRPGNAAGLFSKEKIREEISKEKVKKKGPVGRHTIQTSKQYSAEIENQIKGALSPRARMGE